MTERAGSGVDALLSSFAARLQTVEQRLGLSSLIQQPEVVRGGDDTIGAASPASTTTLDERLREVEERFLTLYRQSSDPPFSATTTESQQLWTESDALMNELDPGTALTHQQQIVAPLMYRRQEIIASAAELQENLRLVSQIAQYLQIQPPFGAQQQKSRMNDWTKQDSVTHAPLLAVFPSWSEPDQQRLLALRETMRDIHARTEHAAAQLDHVLKHYQTLVLAASEKLVLMAEEESTRT
jgi:hypothetical protein